MSVKLLFIWIIIAIPNIIYIGITFNFNEKSPWVILLIFNIVYATISFFYILINCNIVEED